MTETTEIDPEGFERRIRQYVEWLRVNHYSEATAHSRRKYLAFVVRWCVDRGITRPVEVTKPILERYQAHLYRYRKKSGQPLSITSQRNHLTSLKGFFKWLARQNLMLYNPAAEIDLPRAARRLPKHVLSAGEAERVLAVPDVTTGLGLRDRAILETLYSTGMRRLEIAGLKLGDLDAERGTLVVREGKGRRQRVVPIGRRALRWIEKYVAEVRSKLVVPPDEGHVFLSVRGRAMELERLTDLVKACVEASGIGKHGAVHLFRHSVATLMLEGGADVRYVQELLGHSKLETTQIYTQVSIKKLKEVHERTHPAEQRRKARREEKPAGEGGSPTLLFRKKSGEGEAARAPGS